KRHTSTIPIVFVPAGNPVGIGLVESLSHPGGNVTGFSDVLADLSGKYVDFAMQLGKPQAPIAYIWHTEWPDGSIGSKARSGQPNRPAWIFNHEELRTSPKWTMSLMR